MKKVLKITGSIISAVLIIMLFNTYSLKSKQVTEFNKNINVNIDMDKASSNLSDALKLKTISYTDTLKFDYNEFIKIHKLIDERYPNVKKNLNKKEINKYSLLYKWEGKNKDLKPVVLCAHMDVVDVEKDTLSKWKHEPFSGDIAEGKIWGRGARDNKCQVFAILESVEYLLEQGYTPERTIYLAFGHDEEVTGVNGAANISKYLEQNGVEAECIIDEGGAVVKNALPGIKKQAALIGIAEKGYMTLKVSSDMKGGHSSDPAKETAVKNVSEAVYKIEDYKFKGTLECVKPMFEYAAPESEFPMNIIYSNLWITGGILNNILSGSPETDSLIRTSKVTTVFNAGFKDNVVPSHAEALINFRLMPGTKIDDVKKKVEEIINNKNVKVELYGFYNEVPEISPVDTESFKVVQKSLKEVFPDAVSVPFFVSGGTDSKHYYNISDNIYRVTPSIKEPDEAGHGINERIPVENYKQYIEFYVEFIKNI